MRALYWFVFLILAAALFYRVDGNVAELPDVALAFAAATVAAALTFGDR